MKNFLQVNRALAAKKNLLFLNQSFGTVGSPNQTGETLMRENRVGLMSYLRRTLMLLFAVLVMSIGQMWGATTAPTGGPHTPGAIAAGNLVSANGRKYEVFFSNNASQSSLLVGSNTSATTETTSTSSWCNIGSSCGNNNNNISTAFTLQEFVSNVKEDNKNKAIRVQGINQSEKCVVMVVRGYDSINVLDKGEVKVWGEVWNGSSYNSAAQITTSKSTSASSHYKRHVALDATKQYRLTLTYGATGSTNKDLVAFSLCLPQYNVSHNLTNVSKSSGDNAGTKAATAGVAVNTVFAAADGYTLPDDITVTIGGNAATSGTDYTWNSSTGAFQVPAAKVNGAIVITITGEAAAAGSGWGIASSDNSWTASADEMSGSGTVTKTLSLSANADLQFKIVDMSGGGTWYGNGEVWGGTKTQSVSSTGTANNCHLLTTEAGSYTFSFNTSTKDLTITYPNSYTFYYANSSSWSNVYVYKFTSNGSTGNNATWPGVKIATPSYTCGGTDYYAATSDGYAKLIFTDNSSQTGDMVVAAADDGKYVGGTGSSWSAFPTYSVTYNANGDGAGNATGTTGSVPTDTNNPYACGSTVTVLGKNTLAKSGYTFTGWNTAPGGGGTSYAEDATFTISANTTLYAQWEQDKYTVTYNVNGGGSVTPTSATQATGGASLILPTPTWSGYTFEGWYSAGTKIGNAGASYTPTANITLYAHWTDNISGKVFSFIDNNYGDKFKAFDLSGWVTSDASKKDKTYTNATTGVQLVIDNGTWETKSNAIAALVKLIGSGTNVSDIDVIIPTGKIATVKISYGAYGKGDDFRLTVNSTAQANPDNKLDNGDSNAEVISHMKEITLNNQTGTLQLGISNTSKNNYIGRVSATITGYTVSYAAGTYGSGSLDSGTKTAGSSFTLSSSSSAFTRDGYVYDGWSTNADGSTKDYNLGGSYTTDAPITLYPHWVAACTTPAAPTNFTAGSISATCATFTITDAADAASYDIYYSTESTAPTSGTAATTTSTSKTKEVTGLTAATTYYAWVRSVCDASHKSAWVALNPGGDTHTFATSCVAPTTVNVTATVNEVSGYWFYPDDDVVLTAAPTGSPAGSPVTYQWKKNGADIDGATSSTYTIDDAAASDAGKYTCTISYGACSTTSAEFGLKCMQFYLKNSGGGDISNHALTKVDDTHATLSLSLTGGTTYKFRVTDG